MRVRQPPAKPKSPIRRPSTPQSGFIRTLIFINPALYPLPCPWPFLRNTSFDFLQLISYLPILQIFSISTPPELSVRQNYVQEKSKWNAEIKYIYQYLGMHTSLHLLKISLTWSEPVKWIIIVIGLHFSFLTIPIQQTYLQLNKIDLRRFQRLYSEFSAVFTLPKSSLCFSLCSPICINTILPHAADM